MMNAELVAAGERRIIVPTVFRSNYLTGLKALSHNAITRTLIRSLDFLQRYTLEIDFSTLVSAHEQLEATNAFRDAQRVVRLWIGADNPRRCHRAPRARERCDMGGHRLSARSGAHVSRAA
jgi:hypothetical protein